DRDTIAAASSSGDGGNININADNLTAINRSEITANAVSGDGGNITINTRGYFISEDSVVSASSEFGLDGTITINSLENSFQQEIEESEIEIVTIPDFFTPRCANPDRAYLTLNPGQYLPESPDNYFSYPTQTLSESLIPPEIEAKLERLAQELESNPDRDIETETEEPESSLIWQPGKPIVNATEIVETEDGRVFLVPPERKPSQKLKCGQNGN
ncbi:MAG: hypothetical protein SWZ49_22445, partial [Cyanobacteriota bacterium]|nr:hypothetical protein [Cyanobacteriota bacterium]